LLHPLRGSARAKTKVTKNNRRKTPTGAKGKTAAKAASGKTPETNKTKGPAQKVAKVKALSRSNSKKNS
jgi:hypothetical protein